MSTTLPQPLTILTFGDSLTAGYSSWGLIFTPYSDPLLSALQSHFPPSVYDISITTDGVSGEMVMHGFRERMARHYRKDEPSLSSSVPVPLKKSPRSMLGGWFFSGKRGSGHEMSGGSGEEGKEENETGKGKVSSLAAKLQAARFKAPRPTPTSTPAPKTKTEKLRTGPSPNSTPASYDWVIFLGGTNDLGRGMQGSSIFTEIKRVTNIPLKHGARVLMLTVPECGVKNERLDERRDELNKLIREDVREGVFVLDIHTSLPYHAMPEAERDLIWDDGLHFKPLGYSRIGKLVADKLIDIMDPFSFSSLSSKVATHSASTHTGGLAIGGARASTDGASAGVAENNTIEAGKVSEEADKARETMTTKVSTYTPPSKKEEGNLEVEMVPETETETETAEERRIRQHGPFAGMFGANPPDLGDDEV